MHLFCCFNINIGKKNKEKKFLNKDNSNILTNQSISNEIIKNTYSVERNERKNVSLISTNKTNSIDNNNNKIEDLNTSINTSVIAVTANSNTSNSNNNEYDMNHTNVSHLEKSYLQDKCNSLKFCSPTTGSSFHSNNQSMIDFQSAASLNSITESFFTTASESSLALDITKVTTTTTTTINNNDKKYFNNHSDSFLSTTNNYQSSLSNTNTSINDTNFTDTKTKSINKNAQYSTDIDLQTMTASKLDNIAERALNPNLINYTLDSVIKNRIKVYTRVRPSTGINEYIILGYLDNVTLREAYEVYMDLEYRKEWDDLKQQINIFERKNKKKKDGTSPSSSSLGKNYLKDFEIHWEIKLPWPFSNREYVFERNTYEHKVK